MYYVLFIDYSFFEQKYYLVSYCFVFPTLICKRVYVSPSDKIKYSNNIPEYLKEDITGILLGDGTLRTNGNHVLLGIQQTHKEIVEYLWCHFSLHNLVFHPIHIIARPHKQLVYSFQTLTLPYFTELYSHWYETGNRKRFKILSSNIYELFTPRALAMFIMMDGSFDAYAMRSARGLGRLSLHTNFFTYQEVTLLQKILFEKYNITSTLRFSPNSEINRGYIIRIPGKQVEQIYNLVSPFILPSLLYKLGKV